MNIATGMKAKYCVFVMAVMVVILLFFINNQPVKYVTVFTPDYSSITNCPIEEVESDPLYFYHPQTMVIIKVLSLDSSSTEITMYNGDLSINTNLVLDVGMGTLVTRYRSNGLVEYEPSNKPKKFRVGMSLEGALYLTKKQRWVCTRTTESAGKYSHEKDYYFQKGDAELRISVDVATEEVIHILLND